MLQVASTHQAAGHLPCWTPLSSWPCPQKGNTHHAGRTLQQTWQQRVRTAARSEQVLSTVFPASRSPERALCSSLDSLQANSGACTLSSAAIAAAGLRICVLGPCYQTAMPQNYQAILDNRLSMWTPAATQLRVRKVSTTCQIRVWYQSVTLVQGMHVPGTSPELGRVHTYHARATAQRKCVPHTGQ